MVQEILADSFLFDGSQYEPNLQTVISIQKIQRHEEEIILPTIRCKKSKILPQACNDETENILEHNFRKNWDGLQSRNNL